MTQCNRKPLTFSTLFRRRVEADFDGGHLTSDAGGLLLREVDRRLGLTDRLAACIHDRRDPATVTHSIASMLRQRLFGLAPNARLMPLAKPLAEHASDTCPASGFPFLPPSASADPPQPDLRHRLRHARPWG